MRSLKSIRLAVLVVVMAVGAFLLYLKHTRSDAAGEGSEEQQKWIAQRLDVSSLTPEAVPDHVKAISDEDPVARRKAARALWQIGPRAKAATPALLGAVKDAAPAVREMAAKALGTISEGTPDAVPTLTEALNDEQVGVRAAAAHSLYLIWLADKRPAQNEREREDKAEEVRERIGRGLPPRTKDKEEKEREERRERESRAAGGSVPGLKPHSVPAAKAAIPVLTKTLRDSDAHVRARTAAALGETGPLAEPAVGELIEILKKDADDFARLEACLALGNIGPGAKAAVPALVQSLLHDKFLGVRVNTAGSLGQIAADPEKVVPALVEACLTDSESEVRIWALRSISCYPSAPKLAQQALEALAKDPRFEPVKDFQSRVSQFREMLKDSGEKRPAPAADGSSRKSK